MSEWKPIASAPRDREILVWLRGNRSGLNERPMVCRYDVIGWSFPGIGGLNASHWMEIPGVPKDADTPYEDRPYV